MSLVLLIIVPRCRSRSQFIINIDQSAGLYPALTSAGTVLTTSTYVAPVPPMIAAQTGAVCRYDAATRSDCFKMFVKFHFVQQNDVIHFVLMLH